MSNRRTALGSRKGSYETPPQTAESLCALLRRIGNALARREQGTSCK